MLRLKSITKSYTTAGFTQNALDGVSIAFRDNEFAAVLGPSGSGKTTMLNIVGGLDRYDSGDLEIDSISTESYKASDWDTYRNNRIGFVFQSYNLIPHQSVLANVELALTLSGVSRKERRKRAIQALEEVGLGDHVRKKPGQLSGGQMQRVAIARALINDPEILLADEPTGALDTQTSKQVMELLTRIAENRLVIMVTHNNELAELYANRIVQLTDGKVTHDSRPFDPSAEDWRTGREPRKARMSFMTAITLSFSNLMTKKGRTLTTAFAGSIGIIGIATILALSNGINEYIRNIEEETLSIYPLIIQSQGFDLSGFFGGDDENDLGHMQRRERPPDTVREMRIMETVFSTASNNDLASLKEFFEHNEQELDRHVNTIHYTYDIVPQIFLADTSNGADQINPDSIFSGLMGAGDSFGGQDSMGFMPSMNVFYELPNDPVLYDSQYELLIGHWPQSYDEAVLVLGHGARITDFALYSMGIRDRSEMKAMLESIMNRTDMTVEIAESERDITYDTLMATTFKVIHPANLFHYDDTFDVWVDKSGDSDFMKELVDDGLTLKIVGIVQPDQDATATVLSMGINYTPQLITHLIQQAGSTRIVREQLANPEVNVLTGNTFADEQENPETRFDFSRIISVDEDLFRDTMQLDGMLSAFDFNEMDFGSVDFGNINMSGMNFTGVDFSDIEFGGIDLSDLTRSMGNISPPALDLGALVQVVAGSTGNSPDDLSRVMMTIVGGFFTTVVIPNPDLMDDMDDLMTAFAIYINNPLIQLYIEQELSAPPDVLEAQMTAALQGFMTTTMNAYMLQMVNMIGKSLEKAMESAMENIMEQISNSIQAAMTQMSRQMQSSMRGATRQIEESIQAVFEELSEEIQDSMQEIDGEALAAAFQIEIGEEEIFELMMSIMNPSISTYEQTLTSLGYADLGVPTQILIYPRSFDAKQEVLLILEEYNAGMEDSDQSEKVVHFTDIVGMMMSTVTNIIDMVSYALVAFVSVALVVSSIMIGVITFISVLERKKEIGILRAVGASKGNIRLVFNAETLIIGFVAGVLGVLATYAISFIANIFLYNALGIHQLVILPPVVPVILVAISMFLTYIAGLLPASAAASKAPVEALRSE